MKKNLLLFMMFSLLMGCVCAAPSTTAQKNSYIVLTYNKAAADSTVNSISMDSVQIAYFNRFINDPIPYYERGRLLRTELDSLRSELSVVREKTEHGEYNNTTLWVRILLFSLAFLLIAVLFYLVLRLRGLRDEIVDVVRGSGRIKEWLNEFKNEKPLIRPISKSYDKEISSLQDENRDLKNRVTALEDLLRKNVTFGEESSVIANQQTSPKPIETQKLLYADSIIDGEFSHVKERENDDTVFVLTLKSESAASVSIFRQAYGKVIANPSYLEGCEKQIIGNSSVVIVREGEAEKGFNGKWKVVSPLKVEIR